MATSQDAESLMAALTTSHAALTSNDSKRETAGVLDKLALQLRSSETRDTLSHSSLSPDLSRVLTGVIDSPLTDVNLILAQQTGRVAANLAANCDPGRDGLIASCYIDRCCEVLSICSRIVDQALLAIRALTASLLNMVIEGHESSIQALAGNRNCSALFEVVEALELGGQGEESEQITGWIWNILSLVLEAHPDDAFLSHLILPLQLYQNTASTRPASIQTVSSAADILDSWANAEQVDYEPYTTGHEVLAGKTPMSVVLDFIETAKTPDTNRVEATGATSNEEALQVVSADEDHAGEDAEDSGGSDVPSLGKVKGTLINAIVGLSSVIPPTYQPFWTTMRHWLDLPNREDLQCCALLSFGNHPRDDKTATALLSQSGSLLPSILAILRPGITAQVLHAVIGLLRNLSIPEPNKAILGEAGILDKMVELEVWSKDKDMLGSVQGGAVGMVKNLCRGNVDNARQLADRSEAVDQILDLLKRTDDPAVRFESTRVFVNCIRSLASAGPGERASLLKMEDERISSALINMLQDSEPYPVLANESIIALTLLVTFGEKSSGDITTGLLESSERILDILAPKKASEESGKEVRANMVTLLRQASSTGEEGLALLNQVKALLNGCTEDGRDISAEARTI